MSAIRQKQIKLSLIVELAVESLRKKCENDTNKTKWMACSAVCFFAVEEGCVAENLG